MRGKGEGSIFKDGRGLWTGIIELPSHNGDRRRKVIRRKLKQDLIAEMIAQRAKLQAEGDLPTKEQTVAQWFSYWLKQVAKDVRPNTTANYVNVTQKYIIPTIGNIKLSKVTPSTVRRVWTESMADLSSTYQLNAHRIMSVSFEAAVREGRISVNPAKRVKAPRKAVTTLDVLTLPEGLKVLRSVASDPLGALWATAMLTGARRGEVIGLEADRVSDVLDLSWQLQRFPLTAKDGKPDVPADFEYRHIRGGLYLTRPKSRAGWRIIPLVDPLRTILQRHIEQNPPQNGLVFTIDGWPIGPDRASVLWRDALRASGITKNVRLHDLRHSAVDFLYAAGIPEDLIVQIVGHSMRTTTRSYQSRNDDRLRQAMQQMGDMFMLPSSDTHQAELE